jgi:hypothetical protein
MPTFPSGALSPDAESIFLGRVTDLLQHEAADTADPAARLPSVFLYSPEFVGAES